MSSSSLIKALVQNRQFLQSLFLFKTIVQTSKPDLHIYPSLLKSCSSLPSPVPGLVTHAFVLKQGFESWVGIGNSLILMYVKFRMIRNAYRIFDEMLVKDDDLYNSLLCGFGFNGFYDEAVGVFEEIVELGVAPSLNSVKYVILACGEMGSLERGMMVHDFVDRNGLSVCVEIVNSLISMYVKMGRVDIGRRVFDSMRDRDLVSWNTVITAHARSGDWTDVFELFLCMREFQNLCPNRVTFLGLLAACGQSGDVNLGKCIHGFLVRIGLLYDCHVGTALADMYLKCGRVECAQKIFEKDLSNKSMVSWNAVIAGYSQNGWYSGAIELFKSMTMEPNLELDSFTFANVIPAYASLGDIQSTRSVHGLILKKGLDMYGDTVLGTAIVDAYGKCFDIKSAISLFNCIIKPNTATWNAIMASHYLNHLALEGVAIFRAMLQRAVPLDAVTMITVFQSCGELGSPKQGFVTHGYCFSSGFSSHLPVANAVIDMYMKYKCLNSSERVFSSIPFKNIVTWNTMLSGYVNNGLHLMAMTIFSQMQSENQCRPDPVTMVAFIQASAASLASQGSEIAHCFIIKLSLDSETLVMNSLLDSYAKNGLMENAKILFGEMSSIRDQSSWNVMITGYGMNGKGEQACELLSDMEEDGFEPNSITFISLLASCSHCGLIEQGCRYLELMIKKYRIKPRIEHLTCIVDMFSRAGRLEEAHQLIKSGLCHNLDGQILLDSDAAWGALLSACRMNMNLQLGQLAGERLSELSPENCGYRTLVSNLYAYSQKWDGAANARRVFDDGELLKKPGFSMVGA